MKTSCNIPSSQKIWQFNDKICQFFWACMYVWRYRTIPPILSPPIVLKTSFGAKLPNLMTANFSYCINKPFPKRLDYLVSLLSSKVGMRIQLPYCVHYLQGFIERGGGPWGGYPRTPTPPPNKIRRNEAIINQLARLS